jgi:hypothetical protein
MTTARKPTHKKRPPPLRSQDRKLREVVAIAYADPSIASELHIKNLSLIVAWIKTGELPAGPVRRGELHAVENKAG